MGIPKTGDPINGRTLEITVTPSGGTAIILNCTEEVPIRPAMNSPSTETQAFQGGDYIAVTVDGGYQSTTATCEYRKADYDALDQARANGNTCTVQLGEDGHSGDALVTVSTGPTIVANGKRIPTMTVQIDWTTAKDLTAGE